MDLEWLVDIPVEDPPPLRVASERDAAGRVRTVVSGEVDAVGAVHLQRAVVEVLRRERPRIIELDLGGVTFLDAAGTRALVHCRDDARQVDCRLRLTHVQPAVYRVLHLTGLAAGFGVTGPEVSPTGGVALADRSNRSASVSEGLR